MAPQSQLEACYSIVVPPTIQPDIMNEVECIRLCEEALHGKLKNYTIRINTSAIIDCIFQEYNVPIAYGIELLKEICNGSYKQKGSDLIKKTSTEPVMDHMKKQEIISLFSIKGSLERVQE